MRDNAFPITSVSASWANRLLPHRREVLENRYPADVLETMLEMSQSVSHIRPQPHPRPGPNDVAVSVPTQWFHLCTAGGRPQAIAAFGIRTKALIGNIMASDLTQLHDRGGSPWTRRSALPRGQSHRLSAVPEFSATLWPGHENPRTRLGRIRIELGNRFGACAKPANCRLLDESIGRRQRNGATGISHIW